MVVIARIFMKLAAWSTTFLKNFYTYFRDNPSNGFATYLRSQTDWRTDVVST